MILQQVLYSTLSDQIYLCQSLQLDSSLLVLYYHYCYSKHTTPVPNLRTTQGKVAVLPICAVMTVELSVANTADLPLSGTVFSEVRWRLGSTLRFDLLSAL